MGIVAALAGLLVMSAAPAPDKLQVIDLVGEFDTVYQANADKPVAEQAKAIKAHFAPMLPGFYDGARMRENASKYDEMLISKLPEYGQHRVDTLAARSRFNEALKPAIAKFEAVFGPVRAVRPAYLVVSLGEFDGATRDLPRGNTLLFGADMIARYHGDHDPTAFFQHELFHLFHENTLTDCGEGLWCALWAEGLATHVAATLNPKATDAELLLTLPEPIRPAVDEHRAEAACAALTRLDKGSDYGALFSFRRLGPNLPPRFGYYVGQLVAEDLGRNRSLPELAKMTGKPLRAEIEASLKRMAGDCA